MTDVIPAGARPIAAGRARRCVPPLDLDTGGPAEPSPLTEARISADGLALHLANPGRQACRLSIRERRGAVQTCDLMPGQALERPFASVDGSYDLTVLGPDGYVRQFRGDRAGTAAGFEATIALSGPAHARRASLMLFNGDGVTRALCLEMTDGTRASYRLPPRGSCPVPLPMASQAASYDVAVTAAGFSSFLRRFAGSRDERAPRRR